MKKYLWMLPLLLTLSLVQCSKKGDVPEPDAGTPGAALTAPGEGVVQEGEGSASGLAETGKAPKGDKMTGADITDAYVALVCTKYDECKIPGFKDRSDCLDRIKKILLSNEEWKNLEFDKAKMDQCLGDVKTLSCDDFKGGKTPEACLEV